MTELRDYQMEPVADVVRSLSAQPGAEFPVDGLRAQLIAACGTGKTFMSAHAGIRLARHGRILVLVPTLDLLGQTIDTWRAAGRKGPMYAVCSLEDNEPAPGVMCTTSIQRLAFWLDRAGDGPVTIFGTYASLPTVTGAHIDGEYGIPPARPWTLVVVDEAHRTSGDMGKAWAVVHDNRALPAERRLYMTATPRVWNAPEPEDSETGSPAYESLPKSLAASMDDESIFGPVAHKLSLSRAQELGILAQYQIVALEIADPVLHSMLEKGDESAGEARLAAIQVALLKAMAEENVRKVISFHNRLSDAELFSATLPGRIARDSYLSGLYPNGVWTSWLSGEHVTGYRREQLGEFESETPGGLDRPAVLANVKVLAEGVDTRSDAIVFLDSRGSVVDLVQAVGRALRQQPGAGKLASIIVPVIVRTAGTGTVEDAAGGGMVSDPAWRGLVQILSALRAHDSDVVEGLAVPQRRSATEQPNPWRRDQGLGEEPGAEESEPGKPGKPTPRPVLKFAGGEHSAAEVAAMVSLRLLTPEAQTWLRGYAAAMHWRERFGHLAVPSSATEPGGTFPLGRWISNQRTAYNASTILPSRRERLEELGMIWSARDAAWRAGLTAAVSWSEANGGHLAAPLAAMWDGAPVGRWLADQRRAAGIEASMPGALTDERRADLAGIDPWWCPAWPLAWQRTFRVALAHTEAGGTLDLPDGHLVLGEDVGRWARAQQAGWADLSGEQQEMVGWLGITAPPEPVPATPALEAAPAARGGRGRAVPFETGLLAAAAYHQREGSIAAVPRAYEVELPDGATVRLGTWIMNQRTRAKRLTPEQRDSLDALGMRW